MSVGRALEKLTTLQLVVKNLFFYVLSLQVAFSIALCEIFKYFRRLTIEIEQLSFWAKVVRGSIPAIAFFWFRSNHKSDYNFPPSDHQ